MSINEHPREDAEVDRNTVYSPASEAETENRQANPTRSSATDDSEIDAENIRLLPGTGGPDDSGDVEVDPKDIDFDEIRRDTTTE